MKTITLLKSLTITMAVILIAGITFIATNITNISLKSKRVSPVQTEIKLEFPENIQSTTACGDYFCVMTIGHSQGHRLLIIDPKTGKLHSSFVFNDHP